MTGAGFPVTLNTLASMHRCAGELHLPPHSDPLCLQNFAPIGLGIVLIGSLAAWWMPVYGAKQWYRCSQSLCAACCCT